jgi:hypothetical protein
MWRSVGFLMTFAVVLMSLGIVAYVIILSGGKKLRETGWGVLSTIIILSVAVQVASMALIVGSFHLLIYHCHVLMGFRRTSSITTSASSSVGNWISHSFSAPSAGAFRYSVLLPLSSRRVPYLLRAVMNSSQALDKMPRR